ncbi:MAG: sorbosone dehydrogenase family protein [Bacteroidota bacterium]
MKNLTAIACLFCFSIAISCNSSNGELTVDDVTDSTNVETPANESDDLLSRLNLPDGFNISVFAEVDNARSLAISPSGVVYVGNRSGDKVYAVQDTNGDFKADKKYVLASGLKMPNGVAFRNGDLYVAEISRILKFPNIEANLDDPPAPEVVYDDYPTESHHGWKYIAFGPDNKLYVPVGAPCNICESDEIYATITRMNPDGTGLEIVADGVRNTVGFTWEPDTDKLWFTDNGRDMLGDNFPPCELNKIDSDRPHFGYPYCHGGDISDPDFGSKRACSEFVTPTWKFGAHVAPLGLKFYTGTQFPSDYQGQIIVAQHGSWNRSKKVGYNLVKVSLENGRAVNEEVFVDGWLNDNTQKAWGRPVDVIQLPDGSLLVSDDFGNMIYRISYTG